LAFLVEFQLFFWIDICVLERKTWVFEGMRDWDSGVEIDWRLQDAIANDSLFLLLEQVIVGCEPVIFCKLTGPLIECIFVIFAKIVIVAMLMLMSAAWHAANDWQLNTIDLPAGWSR